MSSSFKLAGEEFVGTNGSIEFYVDAIARHASEQFGIDNLIAALFRDEQKLFPLMGALIVLDHMPPESRSCKRFIHVLDSAR